MMFNKKKIQSVFFLLSLFLLSACGGGDDEPVAVQDGSGSSSEPGGPPGGADPSPDPGSEPIPTPTPPRGARASVLAAEGGSVVGVSGASMQTISNYAVNAAGQYVYTGSYKSGDSSFNAIWSGSPENQRLLLDMNSTIEGIESNEGYGRTRDDFSLASDGSVAHVVSLTGPTEQKSDALVLSTGESRKVILEAGDSFQGLSSEEIVESIGLISHSPTATAIEVKTKSSLNAVLGIYTNETFTAVVENQNSEVSPLTSDKTCRIYTNRIASTRAAHMLDNGSLVFQGLVSHPTSKSCTIGSAIVKYTGGNYQLIASEGQVVPGTEASTFRNVELIDVTDDGTSLVRATIQTSVGSSIDSRWSYWAFPDSGEPQLIALEGEAIHVGGNAEVLSSASASVTSYNAAGNLAFWTDFGDANKLSLFGGTAHAGQPYPSIPNPGTSSLQYMIDRTAVLPSPFKGTEYFSTLGSPAVNSTGGLVFYGEVTDTASNQVTARSIWQVDLESNIITELIREGDKVKVEGVDNSIKDLVQASTGSYANTGIPQLTDSGAIVFRAGLEGSTNDAIIYLEPATN